MKKLFNLSVVLILLVTFNINAQTNLTADVYASFFGGSAGEHNDYIAVDRDSNVILAGHTYSSNLPTWLPVQPTNLLGPCDGFVAKFNPAMTELIFSTYIGGDGYDEIRDVGIDSAGNIYLAGITQSLNFPVTGDAFQEIHSSDNGGFDGFFTMLSPDGDLLYSSYIGGDSADFAYQISVIDSTKIFIAGTTNSTNFPVSGAYTDTLSGDEDAFVFAFDIADNTPIFSTYLGGNGNDRVQNITTGITGDIYLCGYTQSSNFPTINIINSSFGGIQDGFITKFNNNGEIIYSRYVGGAQNDCVVGIDVNDEGEVYFIANTASSGFQCSANAFHTAQIGGYDILLGKLNASGDSMLYLSYFGGTGTENVWVDYNYHMGKIRLINDETIVINGETNSSGFPVSDNAYDHTLSGFDIFMTVLNIDRAEIVYSTFLGGTDDEGGEDLTLFADSVIYVCGTSGTNNFPTSPDAYRRNVSGEGDEVFARFILREETPTEIKTTSETKEIILFPNPFSSQFTISFGTTPVQEVNVRIYNIQGDMVLSKILFNTSTANIDLTDFSAGMYLIKVVAGGVCYEEKVLKE